MSFSNETAHAINGVPGRMYARHVRPDRPDLFSAQMWVSEGRPFPRGGWGKSARLHAKIRFDDSMRNGHASFAITGTISGAARSCDNGTIGCAHDDIAAIFPELAHLIRWHLCATDGPMHYVASAIYLAGDRDSSGLRAGESRQIRNGRTGELCWTLEAVNAPGVRISGTPTGDKYREAATVPLFILENSVNCDGECLPPAPALQWVPWLRHGEGKARELDAARRVAVWPDATDAELSVDPETLKAALEARLPALIEAFRADMTAAGLLWSPEVAGGAE
jgi:hypothetical protein